VPRPVRFLLVTQGRVPGPAPDGPAVANMARALRGDVDIVTLKSPDQAHQGRLGDARVFRVRAEEGPEPFLRAVVRQLESEDYDVIHTRDARSVPAIAASAFKGILVYEVSAAGLPLDWEEHHWAALQSANHVVVPTLTAAKAARHAAPDARVHHLPPGVDLDVYDWQPQRLAEPSLTRLLSLGDFGPGRDVGGIIEAIRRLRKTLPVHLMMAGETDPARRQEVQNAIENAGVAPFITVRRDPRPESIARLIADCDVGVLPVTEHAAYARHGLLAEPLLEFWASHRPVVAPDWPALRELMPDAHGCALFKPGDIDSLAAAIATCAADPSLGDTVAIARSNVRQGNPTSARERALRSLYNSILPGTQVADAWAEGFPDEGSGTFQSVASSTTDQDVAVAIVGETTHVDTELQPAD
jgi:glycosyltransferase involved in cell wall biosynthesis